jgi:hypothetical protein
MTPITHKQISQIEISDDLTEVEVKFQFSTTSTSEEEEVDDDATKKHEHSIKGRYLPSKDLVDAFKNLRRLGLEANEIEVSTKDITNWMVYKVKISGDMDLKKSRVLMTLGHKIDWCNGIKKMPTPQITMYPGKDETGRFFNAEKLAIAVEKLVEEAWEYLNGKTGEDKSVVQLPLFATKKELETNFTQ